MRKTIYKNLHRIIAFFAVVVVLIAVVLSASTGITAVYAETYVGENDYDTTDILDDLDGASINGETFDIKNYAFNSKKDTQVITFTEYCYSYYSNQQGNYALYIYVWNPQGLDIVTNSTSNKISLRFGEDTDANYSKYRLYFCSCTSGDYQGLIYKFKVYLTSDNKTTVFETLNSLSRVYTVSEIELLTNGDTNATAYYVSTTYTFTGFAAGYGSNNSSDSTLAVTQEQADTLTLNNIGTAYYRPEGNNGTNDYTQDSLQSVYFAVPNSYVKKYGALVGLSAEWLEAVLYPMLVTADSTAYENLYSYLGQDISDICDTDDNFRRAFVSTAYFLSSNGYYYPSFGYGISSNTDYYILTDGIDPLSFSDKFGGYVNELFKLYSIFCKEDYVSESNVEVLSSSEIIAELERATKANYCSYNLIAEKYASYLFESYGTEYTQFSIDMRDENNTTVPLTSKTISYNGWWQALWGNANTVTSKTFDGILVLEALSDDDFSSANTDTVNAQNMYVSAADYADIKEYYEEWSTKTTYTDASGTTYDTDGYTIYICRYDVSDYVSAEAQLYTKGTYLFQNCWKDSHVNNFFFQETVYLDFDIIDVTFTNGELDTVIGVVNSPIDIVSTATSPSNTSGDDDENCLNFSWESIVAIVLLVVLLIICAPLLPYVAKFIVWIVSLPFKLIAALCRGISNSSKDRKRKKKEKNEKNESKRE